MEARSLCVVAVLVGACAGGEVGNQPPTTSIAGSGESTTMDPDQPCVPGQQIECACPGGGPGAQACEEDGMGFGPCMCVGDDASSTTSGTVTSAATSESDTGGTPTDSSSSSGEPVDPEDLQACLDEAVGACETCECENCLEEHEACAADPGCAEIRECAVEHMCTGLECAGPCSAVIDANGGVGGTSVMLANDLSACFENACTDC